MTNLMKFSKVCATAVGLISVTCAVLPASAYSANPTTAAMAFQAMDALTRNKIKVKYLNAEKAFNAKNYRDALSRLEEIDALSGGRKIPTAHVLQIKTLVEMGRYERAEAELNNLYQADPSDQILSSIAEYAGRIDNEMGKVRRAKAARQKAADDAAWKKAQQTQTEAGFMEYKRSFPNGQYIGALNNALGAADEAAWSAAIRESTEQSFRRYQQQFPNGNYARDVRQTLNRADESAYRKAKAANTVNALNNYIQRFPSGQFTAEATGAVNNIIGNKRDNDAWNQAVKAGTKASFDGYRRRFPNGTHVSEIEAAVGRADEAAWQKATRTQLSSAYNNYLRAFPDGRHVTEATQNLAAEQARERDEAAWANALETRSQAGFENYLANYPNGLHAAEVAAATQKADKTLYEKARKFGQKSDMRAYQQKFPAGAYAANIKKLLKKREKNKPLFKKPKLVTFSETEWLLLSAMRGRKRLQDGSYVHCTWSNNQLHCARTAEDFSELNRMSINQNTNAWRILPLEDGGFIFAGQDHGRGIVHFQCRDPRQKPNSQYCKYKTAPLSILKFSQDLQLINKTDLDYSFGQYTMRIVPQGYHIAGTVGSFGYAGYDQDVFKSVMVSPSGKTLFEETWDTEFEPDILNIFETDRFDGLVFIIDDGVTNQSNGNRTKAIYKLLQVNADGTFGQEERLAEFWTERANGKSSIVRKAAAMPKGRPARSYSGYADSEGVLTWYLEATGNCNFHKIVGQGAIAPLLEYNASCPQSSAVGKNLRLLKSTTRDNNREFVKFQLFDTKTGTLKSIRGLERPQVFGRRQRYWHRTVQDGDDTAIIVNYLPDPSRKRGDNRLTDKINFTFVSADGVAYPGGLFDIGGARTGIINVGDTLYVPADKRGQRAAYAFEKQYRHK